MCSYKNTLEGSNMSKEKIEVHGGNIYKILRERNIDELLDYSSNINPYGISERLKLAILENLNILERYPDPDYIKLRDKIAKMNKIDISNVILGNGATEIIFLFIKVLNPKKILIISPTFSEYERAIKSVQDNVKEDINKVKIDYFQLMEKDDFNLNVKNIIKEIDKKYDLLIICNPNNPTGKFLSLKQMEEILEKCNKLDTKLFVDEAFIEFLENGKNQSIINTEKNKKNLLIIRAFTKFFAIPGLRLGYGFCFDKNLFSKINDKKEPWSVNNIAELAGITVLDDMEYIKKTDDWIREEKKYIYSSLKRIKGIKPYKTEVNFILVKIDNNFINSGLNSKNLKEKMLEKGILIRDASNFEYLDDSYFRLAIKDRKSNDIMLRALKEIFFNRV